jgi:hypothetical protein
MELLVCPLLPLPSSSLISLSLSLTISASYSTQSTASLRKQKAPNTLVSQSAEETASLIEKWLEIVDTASTLNYYFNPQTWVTAASPSVSASLSRQSHPMGYSNSHQEAVTNPSAGVPSGRPLIRE